MNIVFSCLMLFPQFSVSDTDEWVDWSFLNLY